MTLSRHLSKAKAFHLLMLLFVFAPNIFPSSNFMTVVSFLISVKLFCFHCWYLFLYTGSEDPHSVAIMCYVVVERYSVCRCIYYKHSVDMCAAYGTPDHEIVEREVLVGYACDYHAAAQQQQQAEYNSRYSDSGYGSQKSNKYSSRRHRR